MSKHLRWVRAAEGRYPGKPVVGGRDSEQSVFVIFVGRATVKGHLVPGKIFPPNRCLYVASDGKEISCESYEALEFDPPRNVDARLEWIAARDGNTPRDAVPGGTEKEGRVFIGRCRHEGQVLCGKVSPHGRHLSVAWKGKELTFSEYEVLVLKEVKRYLLTELWYDSSEASRSTAQELAAAAEEEEPQVLASKKVVNRSATPQTSTLRLSYRRESSRNWGHASGFTLGVDTEVHSVASLPGGGHYENSSQVAYLVRWGSSHIKTETEEEVAQCVVPPHSSMVVRVLGRRARVDVPYKGKLVRVLTSGREEEAKPVSSTCCCVDVADVCLEYGEAVPLVSTAANTSYNVTEHLV